MKVFIAGICGTFMAGIAQLAKAGGYEVTGCDSNVYPPMSTLLESERIEVYDGYNPTHLERAGINTHCDQVLIGNALSRGNPMVEAVLDRNYSYHSGPQWLHDHVLRERKVIAVAGTHGKTTTSAMLAWILECAGRAPGYLIGGKPGNFEQSAALGRGEWFVIEADEYDTAFFDKRAKFVHYHPDVAVLSNLEFDHADIFDDLDQIKIQFHHLMRTIPSAGAVIVNHDDRNIADVLGMGCWSKIVPFSIHNRNCLWFADPLTQDCSRFEIYHRRQLGGRVEWNCIGQHNMQNALAAIAAAHSVGIEVSKSCAALSTFKATARRLQLLFSNAHVSLYDDFAHHPTAIARTIDAVKSKYAKHKIIAVLELRSNTMKKGCHGDALGQSFNNADATFIYQPDALDWRPQTLNTKTRLRICENKADLIGSIVRELDLSTTKNSVIICMSNGGFDDIPEALRQHLEATPARKICPTRTLKSTYHKNFRHEYPKQN
ncbi:UDP-N-acetylmuramate:L-alanyl-gamma-D-glutamyl-meso-diaminopimelate ligase [Candidatus Spongiihabitans sp.]|uniref:UDP-N-acetylmuramate:L-alanyl-gamma-D-glutamyl- meso-diaminopimelate ligase n=1 Tax=Candidatus Spongiihabitans sp. TaxID=3101308 RepID=UPI003C7BCB5E